MSETERAGTCPLSQKDLLAKYFMQHRCYLLDVASYLDRFDRARVQDAGDDFRYQTFRRCLELLADGQPNRTERLLMLLSDPRVDLLEERDQQSADGASAYAAEEMAAR